MEVIKCGLCKEEIEYSQRCRVYIKSDHPRTSQRSSKRPHIGRYKLISTAASTEHISFARRLKNLRNNRKRPIKFNSTGSSATKKDPIHKKLATVEKKDLVKSKEAPESISQQKPIKFQEEKSQKKDPKSPVPKTLKDFSTQKKANSRMSHPHFQSSFEEYIKPILSKNPAAIAANTKNSDSNSDLEVNRKGSGNTYCSMKNGNTRTNLQEFETYYWLDPPKTKAPEPRKLGYQFENLVTEVKHMKLPSVEWKIKIMVHKQEMVSVSFSNKQTPEKVVNVNAKNSICDISIDNKKLTLLGSPIYIYSIKDLETLLDIMNEMDPESPLIQYL